MALLPGARKFNPNAANAASPDGYVPGSGRGATPFSTRADLGLQPLHGTGRGNGPLPPAGGGRGGPPASKAKFDPFGPAPTGYVPGRGRGATGFAGGVSRDDSIEDRERSGGGGDYSDFDQFSGYAGENLFGDAEYDEEDKEADKLYDEIERQMDNRRKSRREAKLKEEIAKLRADKPTINQQFVDVKRALSSVSKEEWLSIPEVGDYSLKHKRKKTLQLMPTPDRVLLQARAGTQGALSIDPSAGGGAATPLGSSSSLPIGGGFATPFGIQTPLGLETPLGLQTPLGFRTPGGVGTPSLNDLGEARGTVLSVKLDKVMDNVSGQTVIDPKGYLTDLNSMELKSDADIADIKKARFLLKSVTQTNPKHAPGWVAASRLEMLAGKLQTAREMIALGCSHCPKSEDLWLEAVRLEKPSAAKAVLVRGLQEIPHSVRLWSEAAKLEGETANKKRVLQKALEFIPNSVILWNELIALEDEGNAKELLSRAVECVPQSVEMWLQLAKLCTYSEAQKVLNKARETIPTSPDVWVAAAQLAERHNDADKVDALIKRAKEYLSKNGVTLEREAWLKLAEDAENEKFVATCKGIVKHSMLVGVEEINMKRIWREEAEACLAKGNVETARALYTSALEVITKSRGLWLALADLEMKHGTPEALDEVLKNSVKFCPDAEVLWLMAAKQKWLEGDVGKARQILSEAFSHNVNAEAIYLAAIKLERENDEPMRARALLERARAAVGSAKVWMQSAQLERYLGNYETAAQLITEGLKLHPTSAKLLMIRGQLRTDKIFAKTDERGEQLSEEDKKVIEETVTECYLEDVKACPKSVPLWGCAIDCQMRLGKWTVARSILEKARHLMPRNDMLWLKAIELERQAGNDRIAQQVATRALQECPQSGVLWAAAIKLETKSKQKALSVDALKNCENDANAILAVAIIFWEDNKMLKSRKWFKRAITLNPRLGDAWATYLAFEMERKEPERMKGIIKECTDKVPSQGLKWNVITKRVSNWRLPVSRKLGLVVKETHPDVVAAALETLDTEIRESLFGEDSSSQK